MLNSKKKGGKRKKSTKSIKLSTEVKSDENTMYCMHKAETRPESKAD